MMFEGKHIHFSPVDNKPLCSYSGKLCKQRRLNGYAFCIRHILEDNSAPFKQCAHVARYNNQKCTNPIPANEDREFCNSHMQVAGMLPKRERKPKKEKDKDLTMPTDGKLRFADRLRALLRKEGCTLSLDDPTSSDDPYAFPDPCLERKQVYQPKLICNNHNSHSNNNNNCNSGDANCEMGFDGGIVSVLKGEQVMGASAPPVPAPLAGQSAVQANVLNARASQNLADCKLKAHVPKFTKTMNRLQAKIAQNKLLDKLKKSQQESSHNNLNHIAGKGSGVSNSGSNCMVDVRLPNLVSQVGAPNRELSHLVINSEVRAPPEPASSVNGNLKQAVPHAAKEMLVNNNNTKPSLHVPVTVKSVPIKRILEPPTSEGEPGFGSPKTSTPVLKVRSIENKLSFPAPLPVPNRAATALSTANCGVSAMLLSKVLAEKKRERTVAGSKVRSPAPDLPPLVFPAVHKQPARSQKQDALRLMIQNARRFCWEDHAKPMDDDNFFYGFVCSESEESDSEESHSTLHRLNWCSSLVQDATANAATSHNNTVKASPSYSSSTYLRSSGRSSHCQVLKSGSRASQLCSLKEDLRRYSQISQKLLLLERRSVRRTLREAQSFIQSVRLHPQHAAQMLITKPLPVKGKKRFSSRDLEKSHCCYQHEGFSCTELALPYTRHCIKHITYNVDQLLFEHCTAKFADNTQCCVPVFDVSHELPLCWEHAKKRRESYAKLSSEPKPKKARKKTKPSALTRPSKRGKKKKKPSSGPLIRPDTPPAQSQELSDVPEADVAGSAVVEAPAPAVAAAAPVVVVVPVNTVEEITTAPVIDTAVPAIPAEEVSERPQPAYMPKPIPSVQTFSEEVVVASVPLNATVQPVSSTASPPVPTTSASVSTCSTGGGNTNNSSSSGSNNNNSMVISSDLVNNYLPGVQELPLDTAELANQASKLLEEHDFTEVLNKIPDDAFSDLFSDGRNGEYIPTREETEELERALAAVSKDVLSARESLAKLTVTRQDIEELSNTIDIQAATARLLGSGSENLTVSTIDDETALSELAAAHSSMEPINVMTSDLNSFTQAFTAGLPRGNETLAAAASRHRRQQQEQHRQTVAAHHHNHHHHHHHHLLTSNVLVGHHLTNGDSECMIHPQVTEYALGTQFLDSAITAGYATGVEGTALMTDSLMSNTTNAASIISTHQPVVTSSSTVTFNHPVVNGEDTNVSSQWLLNPSLALSQLGYQNGFQVGQQSQFKFPLQTLSAELSLISSSHSTGGEEAAYEDSLLCSMLKDSVQQAYRQPSVQETKPTILAQDGAS